MTWNIQWGRGSDGRVDLPRLLADARKLADFDVLCLQEVADGWPDLPGGAAGNQFRDLALALPGFSAVEGVATDLPGPGGTRRRFGNLLLTRLPVLQVLRHQLPWPADPAVPSMARLVIEATLRAPFGPLRVMTTHLAYYSLRQRLAQVQRLRELHQEAVAHARQPRPAEEGPFAALPRGGAALLMGDMNFKPDSPEYRRLLAPFPDATPAWTDAWTRLHPGQPHPPTFAPHEGPAPEAPYCCDFVFASADLLPRLRALRVDAATTASDHQPLLLELD
ncbi:endonuclease/exonuclease/phosphatase family protein [Azohydromonas caseinilytica]|uniref:endonuclease/exonuclease/phosphatase family protein n=1 Tax=Azohydromonas caseinilytica TaxID=2728836 RepID=UPI002872B9E1|nr:endonuclease/exonuclease/phosphatase family protein [Azohydromonas caseinilytica]